MLCCLSRYTTHLQKMFQHIGWSVNTNKLYSLFLMVCVRYLNIGYISVIYIMDIYHDNPATDAKVAKHCACVMYVDLWGVTEVSVVGRRSIGLPAVVIKTLRIMTAAKSMSLHSAHIPTSEELGEALLIAAAAGNRSKLKKLLDTGLWSANTCLFRFFGWPLRSSLGYKVLSVCQLSVTYVLWLNGTYFWKTV